MVFRRVVAAHLGRYTRAFGSAPQVQLPDDVADSAMPHGDAAAKAEWAKLPPIVRDEINRVMVRVGQALEAYQRQLMPAEAPIDRYIAAVKDGDLWRRTFIGERNQGIASVYKESQMRPVPQWAAVHRSQHTIRFAFDVIKRSLCHRARGSERHGISDQMGYKQLRARGGTIARCARCVEQRVSVWRRL